MPFTIENISKLYNSCKQMIVVTDTPIYFCSPIIVKVSPHKKIFTCYGVLLTIKDEIKIYDEVQMWHSLHEVNENSGYILQSLYQRLKLIQLIKKQQ